MKPRSIWMMPLLPLALAAGLAVPQDDGGNAALESRVTELETKLDAVQQYLQAQAEAAGATAKALTSAEAQGYTAGINYESRQTLLGAWRAETAAAQKDVPGAKSSKGAKDKRAKGASK